MSSRGSTGAKKTGQRYQNTTAFRHNKSSKLTKKILALPVHGLCRHCYEVVEWRKKYRKYKPLTAPKKCVGCQQKTVKDAYHVICDACANAKRICAKCQESRDIIATTNDAATEQTSNEFELRLQSLTERQRRTFMRKLDRGEITQQDLLARPLSDDDDDDLWSQGEEEESDNEDDVQI